MVCVKMRWADKDFMLSSAGLEDDRVGGGTFRRSG